MVKIIIITPFKTGSTTLLNILSKIVNCETSWGHINWYKKLLLNNNFIVRHHAGHSEIKHSNYLIKDNIFDIWFTIIRKPTDIYLSGYFQDIEKKIYPYYYGDIKKVLKTDYKILLQHFLSFEWNTYNWLNYDFNFNEIYKYTNINIYDKPFNKNKGFSIYQSPTKKTKVVVLTIETLSNINTIMTDLGYPHFKNHIKYKHNSGHRKWYKNKYSFLKKNLPKSYLLKYQKEDKKIIDHFY